MKDQLDLKYSLHIHREKKKKKGLKIILSVFQSCTVCHPDRFFT